MSTAVAGTVREEAKVLAFDLWDTLLDRESTLVPALADLPEAHGSDCAPEILLRRYLAMHSRDSMIDSLIPGPHTPFEEVSRRALAYRLEQLGSRFPTPRSVGLGVDGELDTLLVPGVSCRGGSCTGPRRRRRRAASGGDASDSMDASGSMLTIGAITPSGGK